MTTYKFFKNWRALLFIISIFTLNGAFAQHSISGTIKMYNQRMITLEMLRGDTRLAIDSVRTDDNGHFFLEAKTWYLPAMYLISTDDGNVFKIIYNNQNVQFISDQAEQDAMVQFIGSDENKLWYEYSILKNNVRARQELIKPILQQYPPNETFYKSAADTYNQLQLKLKRKADSIYNHRPETMAARLIRADVPPVIDLNLPFDQQRQELITHFFDDTDFADTILLFSDVLTTKMIDFLALHQRPGMDMPELQLQFMRALDVVMLKASVEKKAYLFALEYFLDGFARMGFAGITDYLSNLPHLNQECMDIETLTEIERVAGPHRRIITGSAAPDIAMNDIEGNLFNLEEIKGTMKILLFWSVNCPHCLKILPEIKNLTTKFTDIRVISFVISQDQKQLQDIITSEKLDWLHLSDGLGWQSPVVESYMVYGTPTIFVLDAQNNILSKPSGIEELEAVLTKQSEMP